MQSILQIKDLCVDFFLPNGVLRAVSHVNFDIPANKITGLVGESGSGKTTLTSAILCTVSNPGKITNGEIIFNGKNILKADEQGIRDYKWRDVAMVFQAAQNCLNPSMTIQQQFIETYMAHKKDMTANEIIAHSKDLLRSVRLDPDRVLRAFPHEMSGGMKQRVMIAFAQILTPTILLLDEPTTALDVITQDHIFGILHKIHAATNMTMMLSTHDIAVVAKACDYMAVMYGGSIVEFGNVFEMFETPQHPYTKLLIQAAPSLIGGLRERVSIPGSPPDLISERKGCIFRARCPECDAECEAKIPTLTPTAGEHSVACHKVKGGAA